MGAKIGFDAYVVDPFQRRQQGLERQNLRGARADNQPEPRAAHTLHRYAFANLDRQGL